MSSCPGLTPPPCDRASLTFDRVIKLIQPGTFDDQLTEVLRSGARTLLTQAIEAEVSELLAKHADLKTPDGHRRVSMSDARHSQLSYGPKLVTA